MFASKALSLTSRREAKVERQVCAGFYILFIYYFLFRSMLRGQGPPLSAPIYHVLFVMWKLRAKKTPFLFYHLRKKKPTGSPSIKYSARALAAPQGRAGDGLVLDWRPTDAGPRVIGGSRRDLFSFLVFPHLKIPLEHGRLENVALHILLLDR